MPRSSRSKSHKQSKHSSREYTDFDDDVKMKERNDNNDGKENGVSVTVSKDSLVSGEKRKLGKDLDGSHANGSVSEEYATPSKRRKEKIHGGSDRWNGDGVEEKGEIVNVDDKKLKSKDSVKVVGESKSKTSRKQDVDNGSVVVVEKDGSKSGSGSRSEKRSDKESGRKEGRQSKENKEPKDKDRGSERERERERKIHDSKREVEVLPKQVDNQPSKRGREHNEWPIEEELRNIELEKELEKRMRRREGYNDKDRYQDDDERSHAKDSRHKAEVYGDKYREGSDRETRHKEDKRRNNGEPVSKSRDVKHRGESEKDSKHKDDKYRKEGEKDRQEDKYCEDGNRDVRNKDGKNHDDGDRDSRRRDEKHREGGGRVDRNKDDKNRPDDDRDYRNKEERYREDVDRDHRHKNGRPRDDTDREKRSRDPKHRDVHASRARSSEVETKNTKDDMDAADLSHGQKNKRGGSPVCDERVSRHKDDKDRRRDNDNDKDERSMDDAKVDRTPERGRPTSRGDMEITGNHSRQRTSPSSKFYPTRDHHRVSKQEETKYRDSVHEERASHNVNSNRHFTSAPGQSDKVSSRSLEKITQRDDIYIDDLSIERHRRSDARSSPLVDSPPSSASNGRRHLNRLDVRRNLDVDELGQRNSGSKDAKEYSDKDSKVNHKSAMEGHPDNDLSHVDGDNLSVSSPYTRSGGNHKSLLPPQTLFRTGSDSPLGFGSSEDDRSKSNSRHRRSGDTNMGRPQSNWKNIPNWPSPLANGGYIPFQHMPPPMFNPVMQQFVPPIFGRPPMQVNHAGMPYHLPDGDRFSSHGHPLWRNQAEESIPPPLHGWETNNPVFGDGSHGYGRLDWDHGRTQLINQMWESGADLWKGQDSRKVDHSANRPIDETWSGQTGQHVENEHSQPDNILEVAANDKLESMKVSEIPRVSVVEEEDDSLIIPRVYLSKIDISEDLTRPELYDECTKMLALDQASVSDEFDCKILYLEAKEGIEADIGNGASLFAAIDDSVFKKAMFLYTKHKVPFVATSQEGVTKSVSSSDQEKGDRENAEKLVEEAVLEENEPPIQKVDMDEDKSDEHISTSEKMDMEVDGGCEVEVKDSSVKEVDNLLELSNSNVAVMGESIELGSVNISRIHDESTH